MKEVFQKMREDEWNGTTQEYLRWWIQNEAKRIDKKNKKHENTSNNNASNTPNMESEETKQT